MTAHCAIIKLKPDSLNAVKEWQTYIQDNRSDAIQTLTDEGVSIESWFLTQINGEDYLVAYMRTDDIQKAHEAAKASTNHVDIIHKAFKKETWAERISTELLLDLEQ